MALGHGEHQNRSVENSFLPKQLQFRAGPVDGMAAGGAEGKYMLNPHLRDDRSQKHMISVYRSVICSKFCKDVL